MIRTAIAGADTPMSGELIRILINHPDIEIVWAYSPSSAGKNLTSVHHGLTGDTDLLFTSSGLPDDVDLLFIDAESEASLFDVKAIDRPELKIIDMSHTSIPPFADNEWIYGLSEIFRKNMVRGGRKVIVPGSIAALALISLFPLASHLMLSGTIKLSVTAPLDISTPSRLEDSRKEILEIIKQVQLGFNGDVEIDYTPTAPEKFREIRVSTVMPLLADINTIRDLYEKTYSDHNFSFISDSPVSTDEVTGTDKCIISLYETDGKLTIDSVSDCRMRGGAGDAVHAMNLIYGLHEKTGLYLKAHKY